MAQTGVGQDLSSVLSDHLAYTTYRDIPPEAIEAAKISTLDTLGVILAASGLTVGVKEVVKMVKEERGREESSILGFGGKVPAGAAAFANGAMAHGLDYDDTHPTAALHPSGPIIAACLALSERAGKVCGRDFLTALALGADLDCRLGLSIRWKYDWWPTGVFGTFAATGAAGKILGLSSQQLRNAFGIALQQAGASFEIVYGMGSDLRGLAMSFPARAAVVSALMAQRGITGPQSSFEGKSGLFNLYFHGEYDSEKILAGLGKTFEGVNVALKPWPVCHQIVPYVEATIKLMGRLGIAAGDVEEITAVIGTISRAFCEPLEARRRPPTQMDARISMPFGIAVAAAHGKVTLEDFGEQARSDPATLAMAQRVKPQLDTTLDLNRAVTPAKVIIITKGGQSGSMTVEYPLGFPQNPMGWEGTIEKFLDCASYSVAPIPKERQEKTIETVKNLDRLQDMSELVGLLVP